MPPKFKTRFKMAVPFASKFPIQSDSSSTSMSITFPVDGVKMFAPAGGRKQLFIPNAGIEMFDIERGRKQLFIPNAGVKVFVPEGGIKMVAQDDSQTFFAPADVYVGPAILADEID